MRKVGTGTLTLSNANSYTGGTTIEAGTLNVTNGTGSGTGTGTVNVGGYGTLSGTGIISGTVSVASGGVLSPGTSSVGTKMTLTGSLRLLSGSVYSTIINPIFKYANSTTVNGSVIMAGKLRIVNNTATALKAGDEFKIFDAESITGTFSSIDPAKPADGLRWDLTELDTRGVVKVVLSNSADEVAQVDASFYPNPVTDLLYVNLANNHGKAASVSIVDYTGRKWMTELMSTSQLELNVADLPKGVYFILIENEELTYNARFIKK